MPDSGLQAKARGIKTVSIVRRAGLEAELLAMGADAVVVYDVREIFSIPFSRSLFGWCTA